MRILSTPAVSGVFSLLSLFAIAQSPESILDSIQAGRKPEKIFTHFDKIFYQPGEIIWFKTYITVDGRPGQYSTAARAELISNTGSVITSQIMPVIAGTVSGNLSIPDDLVYDTYIFRFYTQQMMNTGADNVYYKPLQVIPSANWFLKEAPVSDIAIQFFAESGTFLAGEQNIIAFSATDQLGKPVAISGTIRNSQGKEIAAFVTEHNGMGKVEIIPESGGQYTAHYTLPSGSSRSVALPAVSDEGANLLVIDEVLKKRLIVSSRSGGNVKLKPAYILGEMDQTVIFKIDISKSNGRYMGRVPVQDLPGGLLHIAVFNENHTVLAERTSYVSSRKDTVNALLNPVITGTGKRKENSFEFLLPDSLEGTFSVSVTDIGQTQVPIYADNIIAATLVTSNLRAADHPLYDIGQLTGLDRNDAIDLLLLTHDYIWNWPVLSKLAAAKLPSVNEHYIPLYGKAYAVRSNRPLLPGADLAFIVHTKDSAVNSFVVRTDENGNFETPGLFYEDTALIYVRNNTDKSKDKKVELEILSPVLPELYSLRMANGFAAELIPEYFKTQEALKNKPAGTVQPLIDFDTAYKTLEEFVVQSKARNPTELLEKKYSKGLFATSARSTIDFINSKATYAGGNIFDYLKGRYSYMQVMGNYPNYSLVQRNMRSLSGGNITMSLYLDEMQVDASMLITIPMKDIALVRIFTSGIMGTGGALVVYTKKGEDAGSSSLYEGMTTFRLPGFSKTLSFYSPDHASSKTVIKTDNRKTLFWNSSLVFLPEDGKVPVSFFNNDTCKEYKIVIQGFTTNGRLVHMERTIR
ncbi:MAG: hypothetical protein JNK14_15920 [Chitinophagaceae bacterium]|nr:hypothetical protein [Chitinophagaceae bacterium]